MRRKTEEDSVEHSVASGSVEQGSKVGGESDGEREGVASAVARAAVTTVAGEGGAERRADAYCHVCARGGDSCRGDESGGERSGRGLGRWRGR